MKIVIISDSHDNVPNIDKMLGYVKKEGIKIMLHCGDVCAPSVLKYLANNFKGDIYLVFGNVDGDREMMKKYGKGFENLHVLGEEGSPEIKRLPVKVGLTHYPGRAKEMAKTGKHDIIFYGHDHKPWLSFAKATANKEKKVKKVQLVNPGTLAGLFQKATFAVWDTDNNKLELKILEIL